MSHVSHMTHSKWKSSAARLGAGSRNDVPCSRVARHRACIPWACCGHAAGVLRACCGHAAGMLRACCGRAAGMLWAHACLRRRAITRLRSMAAVILGLADSSACTSTPQRAATLAKPSPASAVASPARSSLPRTGGVSSSPRARLVLQRCRTVAGSGTLCHSQRRIILGTWLPAERSVSVRSSLGVPGEAKAEAEAEAEAAGEGEGAGEAEDAGAGEA